MSDKHEIDPFGPPTPEEEMAERIAAGVVSRLRSRPAKPVVSPIDTGPAAHPENFSERIAAARAEKNALAERQKHESSVKSEAMEIERERMGRLIEIASEVATAAKERDIAPEVCIVDRTKVHGKKILPGERARKLRDIEETTLARGWIIARTASMVHKNAIMQEIMLGEDGKLHVYTRDDQGSTVATDLLDGALSRGEVQETPFHRLVPPSQTVEAARTPRGNIYFHTVESELDYPFPPINPARPEELIDLTPEIIQQGLEDFFIEQSLDEPAPTGS